MKYVIYLEHDSKLLKGDPHGVYEKLLGTYPEIFQQVPQDGYLKELHEDVVGAWKSGFEVHIKDVERSREYVKQLWGQFWKLYLNREAPPLPKSSADKCWKVLDRLIDGRSDSQLDFSEAVEKARQIVFKSDGTFKTSRIAKGVYLTSVSFLSGRLFKIVRLLGERPSDLVIDTQRQISEQAG